MKKSLITLALAFFSLSGNLAQAQNSPIVVLSVTAEENQLNDAVQKIRNIMYPLVDGASADSQKNLDDGQKAIIDKALKANTLNDDILNNPAGLKYWINANLLQQQLK